MKWLIRILDDFWQEKGTTFLRRSVLAMVLIAFIAFLLTFHKRVDFHGDLKGRIVFATCAGVVALLATSILEISNTFWEKGCLGKIIGGLIFLLGVASIIALIGLAISTMGSN